MRDRASAFNQAPLADLIGLALRQFKRPLASRGVHLTDADAARLAAAVVERAPETPQHQQIRAALVALIAESEAVLARWSLTFEQALETPMERIPGWETTAEFLEIASEKANAELRIAAGAALLAALGDTRHARKLIHLVERDPSDPDAQLGRRLLSHAADIDPDAADWAAQARLWLEQRR